MGSYTNALSWLVMYSTDSNFSHCGAYAGGGKFVHITTSGFSEDNLSDMFGEGTTFLPLSIKDQNGNVIDGSKVLELWRGSDRYNWKQVTKMGIGYLSFLDPKNYAWRNYFDIAYILYTMSILYLILFGYFIFTEISTTILLTLFVYRMICRKIYGPPIFTATPEQIIRCMKLGYRIEPQLNLSGFQFYMSNIYNYIVSNNIEMKGDIEVPEHLRLRM